MSHAKLEQFRQDIEQILDWNGSKSARDKLITNLCPKYELISEDAFRPENQEIYDLFDLSTHIFKLALIELKEVPDKRRKSQVPKEHKLFNMALLHLKNCSNHGFHQSTVRWIPFSLSVLSIPTVLTDKSTELQLVEVMRRCCSGSDLRWAEHSHIRKLWDFCWERVENRELDWLVLREYADLLVAIMSDVHPLVIENSPFHLVKRVIFGLKTAAGEADGNFWNYSRKYAFTVLLSYVVHRWGLEARDLILSQAFELIKHLIAQISVDINDSQFSKAHMMQLVDDLIQLSMIETIGSHRTMSEKTAENVKELVQCAIFEMLQSAHRRFSGSTRKVELKKEHIRYLSRWLLAERKLNPPPASSSSSDESFEGENCKKRDQSTIFSFEGLANLSFGASFEQVIDRSNAWNGVMHIFTEIFESGRLELETTARIVKVMWSQRKAFTTEHVRFSFLSLLATVIPQDIPFGTRQIPSIESLLKYAISLIHSLPNAVLVIEKILRFRSSQVPREMIRVICDSVSRSSPYSTEVLRLLSALVANTEFDENSRFCSINDDAIGSNSFRKDIIEWLLADPRGNAHQLIYQICHYHPKFCFEDERISEDDELTRKMKKCNLISTSTQIFPENRKLSIDSTIQEIVNYARDKLKSLIVSEVTLPVFILCYEFSLKFPDNSFDFKPILPQIQSLLDELETHEFLETIGQFSEWPLQLHLPNSKKSLEFVIPYFLANLNNQLLDLTEWNNQKTPEIIDLIAVECRKRENLREKFQKSMPFNNFVRKFILHNIEDLYDTTRRFEKYSFLLGNRHLFGTRAAIVKSAAQLMSNGEETIGEMDNLIFERITSSTCIQNLAGDLKLCGYRFDAITVASNPENVFFDAKIAIFYLKLLKNCPYIAQNIVRYVLQDEKMWNLHGKVLRFVLKKEKLLTVCLATIPNMIRFLRIYQVQFDPKSKFGSFLKLDSDSMKMCQKYLKKPKINSNFITPNLLILLFGCEKRHWKRTIFQFWRLFELEPAEICEKIFEFAAESIKLGLFHRLISLLNALKSSEFCKKTLSNRHLEMVFDLTYRSIFSKIIGKKCSLEMVELCQDENLRFDLFQHRIHSIPAKFADDFMQFETKIAFSVENFLKFGIRSDHVNFMDFGLVEFYRQLNENVNEDIIRVNDSKNNYLVDTLASIWMHLPSLRPSILPIVARFKNVSSAWSNFPQPPHTVAFESDFFWKIRFVISLKLMNSGGEKWKNGEFSTNLSILLTSFQPNYSGKTEILGKTSKNSVFCILARVLSNGLAMKEEVMEKTLFESLTRSSLIFPDIAMLTVPFLFKTYIETTSKYDFAVGNLLACLKKVPAEDQKMVYCVAECVDALGLDVMARYERLDTDQHPQFGPHWFFVLARLFLAHGYLNHAIAIANLLFDRLASKQRNLMMIERIGLEKIEKSEEIVDLLVEIYVAESNSVALSSLPPHVQTRSDVRKVMHKNDKEWLKLLASEQLDSREATIVQWMCGLKPKNSTNETFLNSILRCNFDQYPKILDTPYKFVYFLLFHLALDNEIPSNIDEIVSNMSQLPSTDEMRLLMLACGDCSFESSSVEEHVVRVVRDLRETIHRRENGQFQHSKEIGLKLERMLKLAEMLTENSAHEAAQSLLDTWLHECLQWDSVDIALIEICKEHVRCQSGDARMAEIRLREMLPRVATMSDVAVAEFTLVLSTITIEYRNDAEEGMRLLGIGCRHLENKESVEPRLKLLLKYHSVCLEQLSKWEDYRETRSFRMKQEAISAFEKQLNNPSTSRQNSSGEPGGTSKTVTRVRKEQQCEKMDVEKVQKSILSAARKAISSAFEALNCIAQLEDDEEAIRTASLIIFPLIDVIYKYEEDEGVIRLLKEHIHSSLSSQLWLSGCSHVASKCFSVKKSPITRYLYQILCKLVYDYPYHVLHTILMYEHEKNGAEVQKFLRSLFDVKAIRDKQILKEIVISMKDAHSAYREIAMLNAKEDTRVKKTEINGKTVLVWPKELKIFKCKLKNLPIPIISQKIGRPGDYSTNGLITWKSWKNVFSIADGLSAPKIWEIEGSDGKWYKTVWKKDDVRQDVLVEQMFDVTNNMLEKRMLRTYNVVPLDTECGVIEFCGGTVSIKELLCGLSRDKGLHQEFNSEEPSASEVSLMMRRCQKESTETKRRVFVDICRQYSPVFRHFFYTNFSTAHIWRQKIADYRQSLATWSVVCYIVGLGDRHASNILFDQKLCTFVHIDLGMILEYSKRTLPLPEQVPFRISRDLLDPILIEGIENGHLADECTQTVEKLKQNGKVILGVASALLRETMSNFREAEQAHERPSYISQMAIGRLRDKLEGTDDGVTAQSSNLQVRRLLRDATNVDNLSRMFCGWMPFL